MAGTWKQLCAPGATNPSWSQTVLLPGRCCLGRTPPLAILDRQLPWETGPQLWRKARALRTRVPSREFVDVA